VQRNFDCSIYLARVIHFDTLVRGTGEVPGTSMVTIIVGEEDCEGYEHGEFRE